MGTTFVATGVGSGTGSGIRAGNGVDSVVDAGNFVVDKVYMITDPGDTDFTLIGAPIAIRNNICCVWCWFRWVAL